MSVRTPRRLTWPPWARARGSPPRGVAAPAASTSRPFNDMCAPSPSLLCLHEIAATLVQRPEGFLGRRGLQQLVVVPRRLALGRGLHLEQVGRAELAAVLADAARAEGVVVAGDRLHAVDDIDAGG